MFRAFVVAVFMSLTVVGSATAASPSVVKSVNALRAAHGLPPLKAHPRLTSAAKQQAALMARTGRMAHTAARGYSFRSRMRKLGYRGIAAENIAKGQPNLKSVLRGWMNSRGHRKNILHPRMKFLGLSKAKGGGRNYWAMVLGG
ncbi:MAG: CAP domain-containing protein [Pseudomonadota bacterium]